MLLRIYPFSYKSDTFCNGVSKKREECFNIYCLTDRELNKVKPLAVLIFHKEDGTRCGSLGTGHAITQRDAGGHNRSVQVAVQTNPPVNNLI